MSKRPEFPVKDGFAVGTFKGRGGIDAIKLLAQRILHPPGRRFCWRIE